MPWCGGAWRTTACCSARVRRGVARSAVACRELVRRALSRFRLPYITVTPTFSICPVHGYLAGEHEFCPRCDDRLLAETRAAAMSPTTDDVMSHEETTA